MQLNTLIKNILQKITPSEEENQHIKKVLREVLQNIQIKDAKILPGGSWAKDTRLQDTHEVDLFVKFNYQKYKDKSDRLSEFVKKALEKKFKVQTLRGSRDYFQIMKEGITFEIIPILSIRKASRARNITDISPLHTAWVKKHKKQHEICLVKAFAYAQHVYGAETHMRGFSGYVLEILTIHYGSFLKLIHAASQWKEKTVIDHEHLLHHPIRELNASKLSSPLILVDPVDKTRNAAAVLSQEKYDLFIKSCRLFLKKPSGKFFVRKQEIIPHLALVVEMPAKGKPDVIGGQSYSFFRKVKKQLELHGFKVLKSGLSVNLKVIQWFKLHSLLLPKKITVRGPPITLQHHKEKFRKKHREVFFLKGIIYAREKRKYQRAEDLVRNLLRKEKKKFVVKIQK